ncbi:MAG: hypothetical protein OCD02_16865 [Spirochaetaceae bacterium]
MYNLLRKSIKFIVAGLGLLFLFGCTTIEPVPFSKETDSSTLDTIFSEDRDTVVYVNTRENEFILNSLLDSLAVEGMARETITDSSEIFLAFSEDFTLGFEVIVKGEFSKWKSDLGLFLSSKWKKGKRDGNVFWVGEDGIELFFVDNTTLIMSSFNISPLITIVKNSYLESPNDSLTFKLLKVTDEKLKSMSNGFLRGGVNGISVSLKNDSFIYEVETTIGVDTEKKANAFSRLVKLFLKLALTFSNDEEVSKLGSELEVIASGSSVIIKNIHLTDKKIVELINSVIFIDKDVD